MKKKSLLFILLISFYTSEEVQAWPAYPRSDETAHFKSVTIAELPILPPSIEALTEREYDHGQSILAENFKQAMVVWKVRNYQLVRNLRAMLRLPNHLRLDIECAIERSHEMSDRSEPKRFMNAAQAELMKRELIDVFRLDPDRVVSASYNTRLAVEASEVGCRVKMRPWQPIPGLFVDEIDLMPVRYRQESLRLRPIHEAETFED